MEHAKPRLPVSVVVFVVAYLAVFGGMALRQGNTEFLIYTGAMLALIGVTVAVHWRVNFTLLTLWLLAVWGLLHMAGGTVPIPVSLTDGGGGGGGDGGVKAVLYSLRIHPDLPKYDQITHAYGFFAATMAAWEAIRAAAGWKGRASFGLACAAALAGVGLGAVNEVIEFGVTLVVPDHNVGGYVNTGWDLVSNTVGAAAAALLIWRGVLGAGESNGESAAS